jgi:hypothetical protein
VTPYTVTRVSPQQLLEISADAVTADGCPLAAAQTAAVLSTPHHLQLPQPFAAGINDQLASFEDAYWRGLGPGVKEGDLVAALNRLADTLNLPEYAKTSLNQIRTLRMQLLMMNPRFMGRNLFAGSMRIGDTISDVMSPLQALHLSLSLIDQKFYDSNYQVSPSAWDAAQGRRLAALAATVNRSPGEPRGKPSVRPLVSPQRQELEDRLNAAVAGLGVSDALDLVASTLRTLGIK